MKYNDFMKEVAKKWKKAGFEVEKVDMDFDRNIRQVHVDSKPLQTLAFMILKKVAKKHGLSIDKEWKAVYEAEGGNTVANFHDDINMLRVYNY